MLTERGVYKLTAFERQTIDVAAQCCCLLFGLRHMVSFDPSCNADSNMCATFGIVRPVSAVQVNAWMCAHATDRNFESGLE